MTLVGERHRADIVLPSRTPVGHLLPDMHQLLNDRISSRSLVRQLPTSDGAALPLLVRFRSAPPALVMHNVADQVADGLPLQTSHRRPVARRERWRGEPFASRTVRGLRRIVSSSAAREVAGRRLPTVAEASLTPCRARA
ncbi:hypothetical protein GCM10010518_13060 [Kitasatospora cinereorecta]